MKKTLPLLLIFLTLVYVGYSAIAPTAGQIPPELVGEWATSKSEFARGVITSGNAIYLTVDGTAMFLGAPPPIGIRVIAVYDSSAHSLKITLLDDDDGGRPRQTLVLDYDARAKTLLMVQAKKTEVFKRRQDKVPDYILKDIETAKSRTRR